MSDQVLLQVALLGKLCLSVIALERPDPKMHSCMVDKVPSFVEGTRAMRIFKVNHSLLPLSSVARGESDRAFVFLEDVVLLVWDFIFERDVTVGRIH